MRLGAFTVLTDEGIRPATLAVALEERGFESCFVGEHSHVPVRREGQNPDLVLRSLDPIVALTAMAGATTRLRLGTAVALAVQRDPIYLAKEVATLDLLSGGRVELGVGAGWMVEEMRNHGTDPATRTALLRERVLAMNAYLDPRRGGVPRRIRRLRSHPPVAQAGSAPASPGAAGRLGAEDAPMGGRLRRGVVAGGGWPFIR